MAKAALALILMLCCASLALATYDTYHPECTCDNDCSSKNTQCTTYKCKYNKCVPHYNDCGCDDGNSCTYDDKCYKGTCTGKPVQCYTKEQCKYAFCNPHSGKCETKCKPDGTSCEDGNKCSCNDKCYSGYCKPGYWKTCENKSPCTKSYCHPVTGQCKTVPTNEGGSCDDGNPKTCNDKCCNGICKGTYKSYDPPSYEPSYDDKHHHDKHHHG